MIDFKTAIVCDLDKMMEDGAILSVERFFETIFAYAKSCSGEDPAWGSAIRWLLHRRSQH